MATESDLANATGDVSVLRLARIYAEAIMNAAMARGQLDSLLSEMEELVRVLIDKPMISEVFANLTLSRDTRAKLIRATVGATASPLLLDFLLVLNQHNRLDIFRAVVSEYRSRREQKAGRVRLKVRSAHPIPEDYIGKIKGMLSQILKPSPTEVILETSVEPDLIGGLVIQLGDRVFDGSVKARLRSIRDQLLTRSSHEIQRQRDRIGSAS